MLIISSCNQMLQKNDYAVKIRNVRLVHYADQAKLTNGSSFFDNSRGRNGNFLDNSFDSSLGEEGLRQMSPSPSGTAVTNDRIQGNNSSNTNNNTSLPYIIHQQTAPHPETNNNSNINTHPNPTTLMPELEKLEANSYSYILRILVAALIMYDHLSFTGAFSKNSYIDVKKSIKSILDFSTVPEQKENLLNTLRFNSLHLHDESVSDKVRTLLSAK